MRLPGNFDEALELLNGRLALDGAPRYNLVVCGGTALNATGLISRTTKDVEFVYGHLRCKLTTDSAAN